MKVYVNNVDWADEGDVFFFSVIEESELEAMKNLLLIYDDLDISYDATIGWGTNEWFDFDGEDLMEFIDGAQDISDEELAVFKKFRISGLDIYDRIRDIVSDALYSVPELTSKDLDRIMPSYIKLFGIEEWDEIKNSIQ